MARLKRISCLLLPFILAVFLLSYASARTANVGGHVLQLTIDEVIGPATDDYIQRALETAIGQRAELVVIRIDTPGGLDTAMRGIIKNITNSAVPVASFVSPSGARAASAGTYILYASHIAAMAPGTNLGAATPVQIGGFTPPQPKGTPNKEAPAEEKAASAKKQKVINDAVAYIRSLAELHGRNQEWAEKAVREAASLPAREALSLQVIDILATGMVDLLQQIDGREVVVSGHKRTLHVAGLPVRELAPDWRTRLLSVITNPNVAYILMLVGIYGLILEFSNPGAIVPGTVGAISLLLALYAFQLLPINYAGMALILLGVALMVGEAFEPSFGILGIGGVVAFVFGSIILIDTDVPGFGIDISVIVTFAVLSALIFIFVIGMAIKARRKKVVSGLEELLGGEATVIDDFEQQGMVSIHSEHWQARSNTPLKSGQLVKVSAVKGLTLEVEPVETSIQEEE
jgi:membrane-bound serine protease (ClpP class)